MLKGEGDRLVRSSAMARLNLSVDGTVYEEFSLHARRKNKTLFAFTNETLGTVCRICNEGGSVSEIYPLWHASSVMRQIEVMTLPADFLEELIVAEYAADKEKLLKMFWDLGAGLVGLLKIAAEDLEDLAGMTKEFMHLLPIKNFKISNSKDSLIEVDLVGTGRRIESTECSSEFVKAILNGYGYETTKQELGTGTIRIWARKRGVY